MSLKKISKESKIIEESIQLQINSNINNSVSFIFDSGAGAGKTYALIESLKYIVSKYDSLLKSNNQQIICITYTNVATAEIKDRLGNSSLILVSTIHERVWFLIKDYQKVLVKIHYNKVKSQLVQLKKEYEELTLYKNSIKNIIEIEKIAIENKEDFYKFYNDLAIVFRAKFCSKFGELIDKKNIKNFKKFISLIYKINRFEKCIFHIDSKDSGYNKISYDSRNNLDRLDKMYFSHDTLLEYGYEIISHYPILQQIIIDKYPFILIDEYQDTNKNVVKIMAILDKFAKQKSKKLLIGYFGDVSQNIYDSGIGIKLPEIHKNLENITKKFNRRLKRTPLQGQK
jgi:DNA helicase-2/ATP-dependent DNA helicase PcrA